MSTTLAMTVVLICALGLLILYSDAPGLHLKKLFGQRFMENKLGRMGM